MVALARTNGPVSLVPHIVSELQARLGTSVADPAAVAEAIEAIRDEHHMAPCAWAMVEAIMVSLGNRARREAHQAEEATLDALARPWTGELTVLA